MHKHGRKQVFQKSYLNLKVGKLGSFSKILFKFESREIGQNRYTTVSGYFKQVDGLVMACSIWEHFHASIEKAKIILEGTQHPPPFYNPIIEQTLTTIVQSSHSTMQNDATIVTNEPILCQVHQ